MSLIVIFKRCLSKFETVSWIIWLEYHLVRILNILLIKSIIFQKFLIANSSSLLPIYENQIPHGNFYTAAYLNPNSIHILTNQSNITFIFDVENYEKFSSVYLKASNLRLSVISYSNSNLFQKVDVNNASSLNSNNCINQKMSSQILSVSTNIQLQPINNNLINLVFTQFSVLYSIKLKFLNFFFAFIRTPIFHAIIQLIILIVVFFGISVWIMDMVIGIHLDVH